MKIIKEIELIEQGVDVEGIIIPKGTRLFVTKIGPIAPFGNKHRLLVVRVDNGIKVDIGNSLEYMPETAVRDTEIKFKEIKK